MRIVGGEFRGRPLATPRSSAIRPTTDRTREALFNVLTHRFADRLEGARVLDGLMGGGGGGQQANYGQQSYSGGTVQSSDADPYGDPENQGGAGYGNVQSSDADPYGDPENQR